MTSLDSFPGPSGITDATEAGKDLAGLLVKSSAGVPRVGVFPRSTANLITGRTDLKLDVGIFESALSRGGAVRYSGNDASLAVPAVAMTAPVSNTKYAVVYQKQNETTAGDANNTSTIDVVQGTANSNLTTALADARSLLPAGALELGHVAIPAGATATNALTITQTFPFTAAATGPVWVRNATEATAWTPANGAFAWQMDTGVLLMRTGGAWVPCSSDWISYTPTLTNLTPGTGGGVLAEYQYIAPRTVRVRLLITMGGAGLSMPGIPRFTLPIAAATLWSQYQVIAGNAMGFDLSAGGVYDALLLGMNGSSTTEVVMRGVNGTTPVNWASGDTYYADFTYRIA